ncbi:TetR/AcrR family transcriptional regulator [Actinomadura sp. ATCC 31491]|uniref:TetR/AcrR family transcriptional regulator n=1 Tax=Actinomadura luzonensis TaxID=2805427 RepID=A0ABT0FZ47_9ACTN|nr:TetR/AcrR family transcriptional regulator [Actinomadura luzonensis]MCK2217171.1 TetR/AcrR family transcriptional regulator [Actinomadura luzonensis]
MARTTPGVTRQRLIDEALKLFATRGYAATSVADIQAACGLTTGSGALYKHFPSKRALLEEAVRRNLETIAARAAEATRPLPEDGRAALERLARTVWEVLDADRALIRVMLREFDAFPELFEQLWQGVVASVYAQGAAWITARGEAGEAGGGAGAGMGAEAGGEADAGGGAGTGAGAGPGDPEAASAVLLASLTYYPLLRIMIGHTPGDLDPERFLAAWVEHAAATLSLR